MNLNSYIGGKLNVLENKLCQPMKILTLLLSLLIYNTLYSQFSSLDVLLSYDYIESSNWGSGWLNGTPTSGNYPNLSVSTPNSTMMFGAGNDDFEFDLYNLPNVSVDPTKDHYFQMRLAASDQSNFFGMMSAGLDTNDYIIIQLSTDGGTTYNDEIKITGNNNATWDYNTTGFVLAMAGNGLSTFTPAGGGDRTTLGDGWSDIGLYIGMGVTDIALRVYVQVNNLGEDWWLDDFELWEVYNDPLPVELSYFEGEAFPQHNYIEWKTESENNSSHFILEKSLNGESWEEITTLPAAGNSTEKITYSWVDLDLNNISYYRLIQYDIDGLYDMFGPIVIQREIKEKEIIKCFNLMGQEVDILRAKGVIIIIYDDGTSIKTVR